MLRLIVFGAGLLVGKLLSAVSPMKSQNNEAVSFPGADARLPVSLKEDEIPGVDNWPRYYIPGQSAVIIVD